MSREERKYYVMTEAEKLDEGQEYGFWDEELGDRMSHDIQGGE